MTLHYLFGLQKASEEVNTPKTPVFQARRRKSANLIAQMVDEDQLSPELFNLSDLIMASLRSKSQQTITATLHILSAMLRRPHHQSLTTLLKTRSVQASDQKRTVGAHEKEVEKFLSLAEDMTAFQDLETSYEQHVADNRNNLETHACAIKLLGLPANNKNAVALETEKTTFSHKILLLEDPTFKSLVSLMESFFHNDIETNLGLTQVLIDLATCGYMRLEGWLLTSPEFYEYSNHKTPHTPKQLSPEEDSKNLTPEKLQQLKHCRLPPTIPHTSESPIIQVLSRLSKKVSSFRRTIPNFETHLLTCRSIIEPATRNPSPNMTPSRSPSRANTQTHGTPQLKPTSPSSTPAPITISSRIIASNTPTRNASPRGRQDQLPELGTPPSLVSRLTHLQASPSRSPKSQSPSGTASRPFSRSPLRQPNLTPFTPPVPLIPEVLYHRIRVDEGISVNKHKNEQDEDDNDSSESDTSSISPGDEERSPTTVRTNPKNRHLDIPYGGRPKHHKTYSSSSVRSRDDGAANDDEPGDENIDQDSSASINSEEDDSGNGDRNETLTKEEGMVTLGHLLTNVIVLQEFVLEVASVVEIRGALFEEVRYF
jgi:hypothetical protein